MQCGGGGRTLRDIQCCALTFRLRKTAEQIIEAVVRINRLMLREALHSSANGWIECNSYDLIRHADVHG